MTYKNLQHLHEADTARIPGCTVHTCTRAQQNTTHPLALRTLWLNVADTGLDYVLHDLTNRCNLKKKKKSNTEAGEGMVVTRRLN